VLNGDAEQGRIAAELLERAGAAGGADEGDEVGGLEGLVDVLGKGLLDAQEIGDAEFIFVDDDDDGASGVGGGGLAVAGDIGEVGDALRFAVLEDLEIILGEIGDAMAVGVGDDGVDLDEVDVEAQDDAGIGSLRRESGEADEDGGEGAHGVIISWEGDRSQESEVRRRGGSRGHHRPLENDGLRHG